MHVTNREQSYSKRRSKSILENNKLLCFICSRKATGSRKACHHVINNLGKNTLHSLRLTHQEFGILTNKNTIVCRNHKLRKWKRISSKIDSIKTSKEAHRSLLCKGVNDPSSKTVYILCIGITWTYSFCRGVNYSIFTNTSVVHYATERGMLSEQSGVLPRLQYKL